MDTWDCCRRIFTDTLELQPSTLFRWTALVFLGCFTKMVYLGYHKYN
ncbi:hypothetical protein JBW_01586 [Pelosinus fermentans JBW45]|uniref:Uncharacterized protein n=1 Tax=Pelosinus fermentans JBW45 TaxID=1192197 RepID=A0A0C5Q870_9FIRM|nr:hypothetical protein JBW_01586 [Pelosinus fermentans JBW45]